MLPCHQINPTSNTNPANKIEIMSLGDYAQEQGLDFNCSISLDLIILPKTDNAYINHPNAHLVHTYTYNANDIENWLKIHSVCPQTRAYRRNQDYTVNLKILDEIYNFVLKNKDDPRFKAEAKQYFESLNIELNQRKINFIPTPMHTEAMITQQIFAKSFFQLDTIPSNNNTDRVKYTLDNHVLKYHPYSMPTHAEMALAFITTRQDMKSVTTLSPQNLIFTESILASIDILTDEELFGDEALHILDGMLKLMEDFGIPIGMMNQMLFLTGRDLHFIVDDCEPIHEAEISKFESIYTPDYWQNAANRLIAFMDIVNVIPIGKIYITYTSGQGNTVFDKSELGDNFLTHTSHEIESHFKTRRRADLNLGQNLQQAINQATDNMSFYILTSRTPNDQEVASIRAFLTNRSTPGLHPVSILTLPTLDLIDNTYLHLTNNVSHCIFTPGYKVAKSQVLKLHGPALRYTEGIWLVSQLVASIMPGTLDILIKAIPLKKFQLDNLMGRVLTLEEYNYYFNQNPTAQTYYQHRYSDFNPIEESPVLGSQVPTLPVFNERPDHRGLLESLDYPRPPKLPIRAQPVQPTHLIFRRGNHPSEEATANNPPRNLVQIRSGKCTIS